MNQKTAKFLRKSAQLMQFPYKTVKHAFERLTKEEQEQFLAKWTKKAAV